MIRRTGLCSFCEHATPSDNGMSCAAYPDGIPDDILYGGLDHRKPLPEDHGVQFSPDPTITPVMMKERLAHYEEQFSEEERSGGL